MDIEAHLEIFNRFGWKDYMSHIFFRLGARSVDLIALRGMTLTMDSVDSQYLELPEIEGRRVEGSEILSLVDEEIEISRDFAEKAIQRGDVCYVFQDGATVASYGWYTSQTTPVKNALDLEFSDDYLYMYKGFTAPSYRGKRLHGYGMAQGLRVATERGYRGLISFVTADNTASLRSVKRLGYEIFGTSYAASLMGHQIVWTTSGCKPYGFRAVPAATSTGADGSASLV